MVSQHHHLPGLSISAASVLPAPFHTHSLALSSSPISLIKQESDLISIDLRCEGETVLPFSAILPLWKETTGKDDVRYTEIVSIETFLFTSMRVNRRWEVLPETSQITLLNYTEGTVLWNSKTFSTDAYCVTNTEWPICSKNSCNTAK